jgi:hypothetical protein
MVNFLSNGDFNNRDIHEDKVKHLRQEKMLDVIPEEIEPVENKISFPKIRPDLRENLEKEHRCCDEKIREFEILIEGLASNLK